MSFVTDSGSSVFFCIEFNISWRLEGSEILLVTSGKKGIFSSTLRGGVNDLEGPLDSSLSEEINGS